MTTRSTNGSLLDRMYQIQTQFKLFEMHSPQEHSKIAMEINVQDVHTMRESNTPHLLIDCRRDDEFAFCRIDGAIHIPMNETPARIGEIQPHIDKPVVVYCHHGVRSLNVVHWLREQGISTACSMAGGIDAWTQHIDPNVPRY